MNNILLIGVPSTGLHLADNLKFCSKGFMDHDFTHTLAMADGGVLDESNVNNIRRIYNDIILQHIDVEREALIFYLWYITHENYKTIHQVSQNDIGLISPLEGLRLNSFIESYITTNLSYLNYINNPTITNKVMTYINFMLKYKFTTLIDKLSNETMWTQYPTEWESVHKSISGLLIFYSHLIIFKEYGFRP
jgi:hypothetical protein